MGDMVQLVDKMRIVAANERKSSKPFGMVFGEVTGVDPLKIKIDQKLEVGEEFLILTNAVRDHHVWMIAHDNTADGDSGGAGYHDQVTTKQNQDHIHAFPHVHMVTVVPPAEGATTSTSPEKTQTQSEKTDHDHNYHYRGGVFKVKCGLKKDEKVILLQVQGGQSYVVLDRYESPIGTEGTGDDEDNRDNLYAPDSNGDREGYR